MSIKLIQLNKFPDWSTMPVSYLYIGNEYSPDPVDVIQSIVSLFPVNHKSSSTFIQVNIDMDSDLTYIRSLLTKKGYQLFTPHSISIVEDLP